MKCIKTPVREQRGGEEEPLFLEGEWSGDGGGGFERMGIPGCIAHVVI